MVQRKLPQHLFALGRQRKQYLAPVPACTMATNMSARREPIHQLHRAVVLNLQALRQFPNTGPYALGQSLERQHQLVLTWFQACGPGRLVAEVQKAADLMAQFCQRVIIRQGQWLFHAADYIVPRLKARLVYRITIYMELRGIAGYR